MIDSSLQDGVSKSQADCYNIPVPDIIVHPVLTSIVFKIL